MLVDQYNFRKHSWRSLLFQHQTQQCCYHRLFLWILIQTPHPDSEYFLRWRTIFLCLPNNFKHKLHVDILTNVYIYSISATSDKMQYMYMSPVWVSGFRIGPLLTLSGRKRRPPGNKRKQLFGYCQFNWLINVFVNACLDLCLVWMFTASLCIWYRFY